MKTIEIDVAALSESEQRLKTAQALAHVGNWELDLVANALYWSEEIYRLFELDPHQFQPSYENFLNAIHPEDREMVNSAYANSLVSKERYNIQHRLLMQDGRIKYVEEQCESFFDHEGNPVKSIGTVQDITQLKQTEIELSQTLSLLEGYKVAMDESNIVSKSDLSGRITYANEKLALISGYTIEEIIGKNHNFLRHPDTPKALFQELWQTIQSKKVWKGVLQNRGKYHDYWIDSTIVPILDEAQNIKEFIAIRHDITKIVEDQKTIEKLINIDTLTGLPNRTKLHRDLQESSHPCLILINIDRFSQINDFYGHSFGDKLLQAFSTHLQNVLNNQCTYSHKLYRNGGDEFAILIAPYEQEKIITLISQLLSTLEKKSISIDAKEINLNFSCGISFEEVSKALLSADMALKLSKIEQKPYVVYSQANSLNKQYENNILWAGKLKLAIEENRVVPFFQPIVCNNDLAFVKYEALVRIVEQDGKVVSPFFFLNIAKQTKQYLKLTQIMIEKSFEVFKENNFEFSINLTMEDIASPQLGAFLFTKLDENPQIAKRVVLELVESESIKDYEGVIAFISMAKAKGCKIAIDDFGSGYSNFEYLIKLQADFIKIDGSLIKNINIQKASFVVVSTIVSFAKQMGIKTIAEFVENEEIFQTMQKLGIDYSQGYYFQEPQRAITKAF